MPAPRLLLPFAHTPTRRAPFSIGQNVEREAIRTEVERLRSLNAEYNELKNSGPGFNRDKIVSSISLIVGLAYLGSAINEVLKIVLNSGSGEALTAGLDGALALAGIGYFFVRRNGA